MTASPDYAVMVCPICKLPVVQVRHCPAPNCPWLWCKADEIDFNWQGDWILHSSKRRS